MRFAGLVLLLSLSAAAGEYVLPQLPEGLEAKVVAQAPAISSPVSVAVSPDGRSVYTGTRGTGDKGEDRVYLARDAKGDGNYDRVSTFAQGRSGAQGLLCVGDTVYFLHGPWLTALRGLNEDGAARESKDLLTGLGPESTKWLPKQLAARLALGADGWLYIALGDWGVYKGKGADGKTFQLHGGGIVRVRPDGKDVEVFCQGLRNMVALAMDPELNVFVRDNSNDGAGLSARSLHVWQGADYGYPNLFQNYPEETLPAMQEHGGGLPSAALLYDKRGLRETDIGKLLVADWGRGAIYACSLARKGASFELRQEEWLKPQFPFRPVDMAASASGNLYIADWGRSSFGGPEACGAVLRISEKTAQPPAPPSFVQFEARWVEEFARRLGPFTWTREEFPQQLLASGEAAMPQLLRIMEGGPEIPHVQKVFALWTYKQIAKAKAAPELLKVTEKPELRQHALRALTDRMDELEGLPLEPFAKALKDEDPFVRAQAAVSLTRLGAAAPAERAAEIAAALSQALGDSEAQVRHLALRGLRALKASEECLKVAELAGTDSQFPDSRKLVSVPASRSALLALRGIHTDQAAEGLLALNARVAQPELKAEIIKTMGRLAQKEDTWSGEPWGPQPDTAGPFQNPVAWSSTEKLAAAVKAELSNKDERIAGAALWALACMRDDSAVDEVAKLAEQGAVALKALATRALLAARSTRAVEFYTKLLVDKARSEQERIQALDILRCMHTPETEEALAQAMAALDAEFKEKSYDKNTGLLVRARLTVEGLSAVKAVLALQALFKEPATTVQTRLASARVLLSQPRRDIVARAAATLLNDKDPAVVSMAMHNLPAKGPITVAHLRPFLLHRELGVQAAALITLGRLKDAESAELIATRLAKPELQDAAIEALSLLGACGHEGNIVRTVETIVGLLENHKFSSLKAEARAIACAKAWAGWQTDNEETSKKLAAFAEDLKGLAEKLAARREQFSGDILARAGNAGKGEALFKDAQRLGCARCHAVGGTGGDAGPNLSSLGALKEKRYVLDSILEPEQDIASGFEPVKVTVGGRRLYGAMLKRTAARFDLAQSSGLRDTILEAEAKDKTAAPGTVMPAGLADGLTPEELADLLAYLMAQRK